MWARYLISAILLCYFKVEEHDDEGGNVDEGEWARLMFPHVEGNIICPPLLTYHEVSLLKKLPMTPASLVSWAVRATKKAYSMNPHTGESSAELRGFYVVDLIVDIRRCISNIVNTLAMPIPFPYYHMLTFIMMICYTLFAFAFTTIPLTFSPVLMLIVLLIFTGLRELAAALSNPFGEDDVDFPVNKYMRTLRADFSLMAGVAGACNATTRVIKGDPDLGLSPENQCNALHDACSSGGKHSKCFDFPPMFTDLVESSSTRHKEKLPRLQPRTSAELAVVEHQTTSPNPPPGRASPNPSPGRGLKAESPITPSEYYRRANDKRMIQGYNWATGQYYFANTTDADKDVNLAI